MEDETTTPETLESRIEQLERTVHMLVQTQGIILRTLDEMTEFDKQVSKHEPASNKYYDISSNQKFVYEPEYNVIQITREDLD